VNPLGGIPGVSGDRARPGFPPTTAAAVVVANMVGTGVFTSLGFQLLEIRSGFALLALWAVGGLIALCGALSYAELAAALPRSGGEYNFLGRIYHPAAGFISGWISATIGFAAPTALAAITFGRYLASVYPALSPTWLACGLVMALAAVHARDRRSSGGTQSAFTALKIVLIVAFCALALALVEQPQAVRFVPAAADLEHFTSGAFAIALIYVNYAYSGWNASTYLTGELEAPQRHMPRVMALGTSVVLLLYLMLNFTFLYVAPMDAMAGKVEIGYVAARHAFGPGGSKLMGVILALLLISTVSAMLMAGPRVLQVIGEDFRLFRPLARINANGIPVVAVLFQAVLTLLVILSGTFESILVFAGFTLGLNSLATVFGVFVLRHRRPEIPRPYRTWGYPLPPAAYIALMAWTLAYITLDRPVETMFGGALIGLGCLFYALSALLDRDRVFRRERER